MGFSDLPKDLKNIVCRFAYNTNYDAVENDLQTIEKIKEWQLSKIFLRHNVYSSHYMNTIPSPLAIFEPICNFSGRWRGVVDEMLWRLQVRKKHSKPVPMAGAAEGKLGTNPAFRQLLPFLVDHQRACFKPVWEQVRFNQIKSFQGPYWRL